MIFPFANDVERVYHLTCLLLAYFFCLWHRDWVRIDIDTFATANDTYAETLPVDCLLHVFVSACDGLITFPLSFYSHCLVPSSVPTPFHLYSSLPS